jgi:exopolyphosphatase/guanosine-5'-triphosphate,3'-diphosphate pyrophosphatase
MKLAAIDIGSNAVRLVIVRVNENPNDSELFKKLEFIRVPIRLGDDAFKDKQISKEKSKIFKQAMRAFKLMIDAFEVDHYMACATSAMREAVNGQKIADKIYKKCGLKINIITGVRESEIILRSIKDYFKPHTNYLTIDVGGGSTEMAVIRNGVILNSASFNIGTVRMVDGAVNEKTWQTIESWVKHKTEEIPNLEAVVTSGTINKISVMLNPGNPENFTRLQLKDFHRKVSKMSLVERMDNLKLNPDRADIIDVSADIYLRILNWCNIEIIHAPNAGLKDGILNELYDKFY